MKNKFWGILAIFLVMAFLGSGCAAIYKNNSIKAEQDSDGNLVITKLDLSSRGFDDGTDNILEIAKANGLLAGQRTYPPQTYTPQSQRQNIIPPSGSYNEPYYAPSRGYANYPQKRIIQAVAATNLFVKPISYNFNNSLIERKEKNDPLVHTGIIYNQISLTGEQGETTVEIFLHEDYFKQTRDTQVSLTFKPNTAIPILLEGKKTYIAVVTKPHKKYYFQFTLNDTKNDIDLKAKLGNKFYIPDNKRVTDFFLNTRVLRNNEVLITNNRK